MFVIHIRMMIMISFIKSKYVYWCTCEHLYICIYIYLSIYLSVPMYIHTCIHVYIHTYTHDRTAKIEFTPLHMIHYPIPPPPPYCYDTYTHTHTYVYLHTYSTTPYRASPSTASLRLAGTKTNLPFPPSLPEIKAQGITAWQTHKSAQAETNRPQASLYTAAAAASIG